MIHVLIIEDEPAIARGLSLLITKNYPDFQVLGICKNGRDGLQKILEQKPELVFTDITMPVMNGLDMIEKVQKSQFHTRFVILTGYADFEYARKAIHLGVSDYLLNRLTLKLWTISSVPVWHSRMPRRACSRKNTCNVHCTAIIWLILPLFL